MSNFKAFFKYLDLHVKSHSEYCQNKTNLEEKVIKNVASQFGLP